MDKSQRIALYALIAVGVGLTIYVIQVFNSESARLEAETQAREEHFEMCSNWYDRIENWRADLNGRENSLGGALDLDGSLASYRNQFNLEVDRYNTECVT